MSEPSDAISEAMTLGLSALSQLVTRTPDGITVVDAERRWVYANPAACRMLDRSLADLRGQDFLSSVPEREQAFILSRLTEQLRGEQALFSALLALPDGTERELICSTFGIELAGNPHVVSVSRDITIPRAAARAAAALSQTAAQLVGTATTDEVLAGIARHAYEGTRALSAGIAVMGEAHTLAFGGGYGPGGPNYGDASESWLALTAAPGEVVVAAMTNDEIIIGGPPGKAVVLPDARAIWEASPVMRGFAQTMAADDWQGAICVPMSWDNQVIGLLGVYLPAGMARSSEAELAFCTALADQASVAVVNARLAAQAAHAAALAERTRLARELHDSVSQALFSMTMHTRAAELALHHEGLDTLSPLGKSITQLAELAIGTLAEMRALIFELRPEALSEEGLVGALRKQAAALAAREQITITVKGPDEPVSVADAVEEHLYRLVSEALHNTVKHARATEVLVRIVTGGGGVEVTVRDDGIGFDPNSPQTGHLGLITMAERAKAVGGELFVTSHPGAGTVVGVRVPAGRL